MNELSLKPPLSIAQQEPRRLSFEMTKKVNLSADKMQELERQVKLILEDSIRGTSVLRRRLNVLNDMLEGVVREVNYPFPNASNIDVKMAIGTARTMRSTMVRALFSDPDRVFVASIDDESMRDGANAVEDAFNWKGAHDNGLVDALKDAIIPTFRDGTAFLEGHWEKRVEKVIDYRTFVTVNEFLAEYPTPEDAGVEEEKFNEILQHLAESDSYVEVCFERDHVKKDDACFSIVTLARFNWWPLSARSLDDCEMYSVRMVESEATMKRKRKTKEYWKEAVDACLSASKEGSPVSDMWDRSRDFIEGIASQSDSKRKEFENFRVVLTIDLDDDDIQEKYMGVFNLAKGRFLNFDRYKIRKNIDYLVPLRFVRRDDRLLGPSLLYDGMDLFQEITDIHRHRNNSRLITDTPAFKAEDDLKDSIETTLSEYRPGLVVWLPKGRLNGVDQFQTSNRSNTQNSVDEENLITRYVEFVIGPTQGLSGQESKEDPNAPATKHLSKIRQAGMRMDDYLDEYKRSFPSVGELALALYYQYGNREISFQGKDEEGNTVKRTMDRALFGAEGLTLDLNARSVIMSPEFEMERVMALRQEATQNPVVMVRKPEILVGIWNRFLAASRVQNPEELKVEEMPAVPGIPGLPPTDAGIPGAAASGGVGTGVPPLKSLISSLGIGNDAERPRV